jgi:hypothetical protein
MANEPDTKANETVIKSSWYDDIFNGIKDTLDIIKKVGNAATNVETAIDSGAAAHITDDPLTFKLSNIPSIYIIGGVALIMFLVLKK